MKIIASCPIKSWKIEGEKIEVVTDFYFLGLQNHCRLLTAAMKLKDACSLEESYDKPRQHIKKQRHYFADKHPSSHSYVFFGNHECM